MAILALTTDLQDMRTRFASYMYIHVFLPGSKPGLNFKLGKSSIKQEKVTKSEKDITYAQ